MKSSPLDVGGERIIPSVTRVFTDQQTLYVFFQAYLPQKGGSRIPARRSGVFPEWAAPFGHADGCARGIQRENAYRLVSASACRSPD